jgi:hypothetical protein
MVVERINDYLGNQGINISVNESAHEILRSYVEREEMKIYTTHAIARAVAVITWCSVSKVMYESLQWAQVPHIRSTMNPFTVYPADIRDIIVRAHKPKHPDDPCFEAVESINSTDIADNILPEDVKRFIEDTFQNR